MSESNNENTRALIEDKINAVLSGDALKNALDFVTFLRARTNYHLILAVMVKDGLERIKRMMELGARPDYQGR